MRQGRWRLMGAVPSAAAVLVAAFLGLATRGETHLADGGNTGVIHACRNNDSGKLKLIKPLDSCKAEGETAVHWLGTLGSPFIDLGLVVLDIRTGLIWEKKTTAVGSGANAGDLHDVDNTYTWCNATGISYGAPCPVTSNWIAAVNAEAFAGFTDWRVPTRDELAGILLAPFPCGTSPCIDPIFGPTAASSYWSATESDAISAWNVKFDSGDVVSGGKTFFIYVRAVRTGP